MPSNFSVSAKDVDALLGLARTYRVPAFQRHYSWREDEVTQLLKDIFSDDTGSYFLGSIVLVQPEQGDAEVTVLDGQQRLVTLSLTIAVLRERMLGAGDDCTGLGTDLSRFLTSYGRERTQRQKLALQAEDDRAYRDLIASPSAALQRIPARNKMAKAVKAIKKELEALAPAADTDNACTRLVTLRDRLVHDIEIVEIIVPSERDAFRLFETLNDRGLALSAADLIKNKLLSKAGDLGEQAASTWASILAVVADDDIVGFLRAYWIATQGAATKLQLYDKFESKIRPMSAQQSFSFVEDLRDSANLYEPIFAPDLSGRPWGVPVSRTLQRLNIYGAKSCRPALLAGARKRAGDMQRLAEICESITIRYLLVGERNPNRLEALYADIARIIRTDASPFEKMLTENLFSIIPSDEDFLSTLENVEVDYRSRAWRQLLIELTTASGDRELRIEDGSLVHLEHILPQTPSEAVFSESGIAPDAYPALVNRIGNLTFLSGKRNIALSNRPFSVKREKYAESDIGVTRRLAERSNWTLSDVQSRSSELAQIAVGLYPHPNVLAAQD